MDHILSVCSGIGGLDLGLHAGLRAVGRSPRTVCMVEREAFCCAVLGKQMQAGRLDQCPVWCGDLADVPTADLPRVDWYIGGYPCQPFSAAGKRRGADDSRHLWPVIKRQLHAFRPRGVFFENVSGHVTLGLRDVLGDLERLGFGCAFGIYSAAEVGAPHRRDRVFILGLADTDREDKPERDGPEGLSKSGRNALDLGQQALRQKDGSVSDDSLGGCRQGELADSDISGLEGDGESDGQPEEAGRSFRDHAGGRGADVANAKWPARPGKQPHEWEPPRTVPVVRGSSDGIPNRVDRLRALGNAVVPQQAEHAFVRLWNLLT